MMKGDNQMNALRSAVGSAAGTTVLATTATAGTAGSLAYTGVNIGWQIIAGLVLLGIGGTLWRLVPRRVA